MSFLVTSRSLAICLAAAALLASAPAALPAAGQPDPLSVLFPHEWVGDIDRISFREPSGIVYHPLRHTLFAVGDEGDVCEIKTDGEPLQQAHVRDADFEGITCHPDSGLLYVAIEGEEAILEVDPDGLRVLREFTINRTFHGATVLKPGGQGIEAITFVPDPHHPQGGLFYLANQSLTLDDPEDPSIIFTVELPLTSAAPASGKIPVDIVSYFYPRVIDISGLYYDASRDLIYAISDSHNALLEITPSGETVRAYAFPGDNQEGITVDPDGYVYIAQDSGGIVKLKWRRPG